MPQNHCVYYHNNSRPQNCCELTWCIYFCLKQRNLVFANCQRLQKMHFIFRCIVKGSDSRLRLVQKQSLTKGTVFPESHLQGGGGWLWAPTQTAGSDSKSPESTGSGRAPLLTQGPRPARVRGAGSTVLALLLLKFMIGFEIHPLATEQIASPILH